MAGQLLVSVASGDVAQGRRIKAALEATGRFSAELAGAPTAAGDNSKLRSGLAALHIVEVAPENPGEIAALERYRQTVPASVPVIAISTGLAEAGARQFLKLKITDWLPSSCSEQELVLACEQALRPQKKSGEAAQARCVAFMSAMGGAGASTLALAAAGVLAGRDRTAQQSCCVVDLDFQHGALAEHIDIAPALHLDEIGGRPERLDRHLLEIMLTRHASGLAVLVAPPSLDGSARVKQEVIGRLLDLAAADFSNLVLDLPSHWQHWSDDVVRGLDAFLIVTEMTVTGMRQARRLAEMVHARCGIDVTGSVIANKSRRFGGSLSRRQAKEALGPMLGGFVADCAPLVRRAQDSGVMLASLKRRNRVSRDIEAILTRALEAGSRRSAEA